MAAVQTRAALVNLAWAGSGAAPFLRYRAALANPAAAQARLLQRYLRDNADTDFGRRHGFARVRTPADFRAAVPLRNYDDFAPYVDRVRSGEPNVLTAEPVRRLVPSGGSTRAAKLVPYTRSLQSEFSAGIGPWVCDLFRLDPNLMAGPAYWSVSPAAQGPHAPEPSAVPVGFDDDSAYLGGILQRLIGAAFAVPSAVRHVPDVESFRYVTLLCLLRSPELRLISVWHPSFLALLLDDLPLWFTHLVGDLAEGSCRARVLPAELGALRGRPMPRRARELERKGPRNLCAIWPRLGLLSCWADAHAALHVEPLAERLPGVAIQPKGLIATEAFVSLPFAGLHPLAIRSHFFEFLDDRGGALLAHELEQGREYRVVVTTGGGLYRYCLDDRIRVEGFAGRTPSVRFAGKEDHVSDVFGEKLSEGFVGAALRCIFSHYNFHPLFAMLAPEPPGRPTGYALFLQPGPGEAVPPTLAAELDEALAANPHYRYCRDLGQLAAARVCALRRGGYAAYVAECQRRGQRLGDVKASPLSRHAGWASVFTRARCRARWIPDVAPVHSAAPELL
jgi:hypothetical protein